MACFVGDVSSHRAASFCFPLLHNCSPQFFKTIREINVVFCLKNYCTTHVYASDHHNVGFYSCIMAKYSFLCSSMYEMSSRIHKISSPFTSQLLIKVFFKLLKLITSEVAKGTFYHVWWLGIWGLGYYFFCFHRKKDTLFLGQLIV